MSRARKKPLQLGETFELSLHEEAGVSQAVFQIEGEPERGGPGYLWDNEELPPAARPGSCKLSEAWILSCRPEGSEAASRKRVEPSSEPRDIFICPSRSQGAVGGLKDSHCR